MELHDFLRLRHEEMPIWLENYNPGDVVDFSRLLSSRIVYYPGSRFDGQPIKTFNKAHFAHVYIYADYAIRREEVTSEFLERGFLGYRCIDLHEINEIDLAPNGWRRHIDYEDVNLNFIRELNINFPPFGYLGILERRDDFNEEHGAKRFAVIMLCADGIATYDALFANENIRIHTLVLQDHGFGGNYDRFGQDGLMHQIARRTNVYPEFILCAYNTKVWDGYTKLEDVLPVCGGESFVERYLYQLNE